jgi:hypothetical protein
MPPTVSTTPPAWLMALAEHAVLTALETANRRLLRRVGRSARHHSNRLRETDPVRWHLVIEHDSAAVDVDGLLDGVLARFDQAAACLDNGTASCLHLAVETYLRTVIGARLEHHPDQLARVVGQASCLTAA